jgi:hypothetical protein
MARSDPLTAGTLAALAGLHVAWGRGSSLPFPDRRALAELVVGTDRVPGPAACYAVAGALAAGCVLVLDAPWLPPSLRRVGLLGMAGVFFGRGALGLAGRTNLVAPGSESPRFRRLDRRLYSPLCIGLALGSLAALD